MGNIKVSIEAFGDRPLTRVFQSRELEKMDVRTLVKTMVEDKWPDKDLKAHMAVSSEVCSSGDYAVKRKVGGDGSPVFYEPVLLNKPVSLYTENHDEMPKISLAVSGHHIVGYNAATNTIL